MNRAQRFNGHRIWLLAGILAGCLLALFGCKGENLHYELEVRHMHFPNFQETHRVGMGETFVISDSEYSARVVRFEPDFAIDMESKEVFSRSEEMNNPAVLVEVFKDGEKAAEQWAFRTGMPHMGGKTPLVFSLISVTGPMEGTPADSTDADVVSTRFRSEDS